MVMAIGSPKAGKKNRGREGALGWRARIGGLPPPAGAVFCTGTTRLRVLPAVNSTGVGDGAVKLPW